MAEPARATAPVSLEDRLAERKPKSHRWTRWQREVKRLERLPRSPTLRQVIDELVFRADNETGEWRLFLREIADAMTASERTVQRRMRDLANLGLIEYRPGRSNPKTKSWFRLIPLEDGVTPCRPRGDSRSPQPDRQPFTPGATAGHPRADSVSPLTAVPTPQWTEPPRPPNGGRRSDHVTYEENFRTWVVAMALPLKYWVVVRSAVQRFGWSDRAVIVADLEKKTPWRDGAELSRGSASTSTSKQPAEAPANPAATSRSEQLTFDGEGWATPR